MPWFAAHALIMIKVREGLQTTFPVWENVILVEAASAKEAGEKAERVVRPEERLDDGLTLNDQPATRVFVGIRKVISITNPAGDDEARPTDGSEISYSYLELPDERSVLDLAKGAAVYLRYVE